MKAKIIYQNKTLTLRISEEDSVEWQCETLLDAVANIIVVYKIDMKKIEKKVKNLTK